MKQAMAANNLNALWSNKLDIHARNINEQQTVGIPIGPDTSLLIAECILAAVDEELITMIPGLRGVRFIDDYEFVVNLRSEAELVISTLQSILSKYELALNPTKTQIIELPHPTEPLWTSRLRTFVFREAGVQGQKHDLTAYFDNVFTFAKASPGDSIFNYAIPRLNAVEVEEDNWQIFQHMLSQCARCEPACLPQVCEQVLYYQILGRNVDTNLWSYCLEYIILERLPLGQASEALWALWMMKQLGIPMSALVEAAIDNCEDSPVALMALSMAYNGLGNPAAFTRLHAFAEPVELFGRHWLLCYEANKQGWLTPPSGVDALSIH
ncbi:MAG: RNA-directed DNA polymerase, partial [Prosthecobacter sp.]|nr:RNA-directed DNA polymerase [Prosthecobacter sp.]